MGHPLGTPHGIAPPLKNLIRWAKSPLYKTFDYYRKDKKLNEIFLTGCVSIISVSVGFLGSYFLLNKQIVESRKERIRDRKIASAKDAIDSACELLGAISDFSDMNKAIIRATQNKANLITIMEYPDLLLKLKNEQPKIHEATTRYRNIMANTWKAYAALRISFPEDLGNNYVDFTNYLNSQILEDIREKWPDMLGKANILIDKVKKEIESF